MTWFKVDDGLHKHRKRIRLGMSLEGMAAMGLWTVAGSWASDELTDGWVPDDVVDYLAPMNGADLAKRLERAGLWERVERDGEDGWQFHEWASHQPTKDRVLAERAAAAERQQRARDRAKAARTSRDRHGVTHGQGARDVTGTDAETAANAWERHPDGSAPASAAGDASAPNPDVSPQEGPDNGIRHAVTDASVTVPPTRPDPTRPVLPTEVGREGAASGTPAPRKRGTRLPDDFTVTDDMKNWHREKCPHVDGPRETEKFRNYWTAKSGKDATKHDWTATWRNWMLRAADDLNGRRSPAATGANRHVDSMPREQRRARNPFANAVRSSQTGATA